MVALEGKSGCNVQEMMIGEWRKKCAKAVISLETEMGSLWAVAHGEAGRGHSSQLQELCSTVEL